MDALHLLLSLALAVSIGILISGVVWRGLQEMAKRMESTDEHLTDNF
jgi:hypothetical protein